MADFNCSTRNLGSIVWVYTGAPDKQLDAATWLETTRELRKIGWNVQLLVIGNKGKCIFRGVETICMSKPNIYLLGQAFFHLQVIQFLIKNWKNTDIVLFHQMSALWLLPLKLIRRFRMKKKTPLFVMDTRTVPMTEFAHANSKDKIRSVFSNFMNSLANRFADGHTTITQQMAHEVKIPEDRLWGIWPSGVNLEQFSAVNSIRKWPSQEDPIKLVYIGALHYQRNLMSMCLAVEQAHKENMSFTLTLVGDGTEREALADFAQETDGRIRVLPSVPHESVPQILGDAHVGVLPFPNEVKFQVSSPIKLFEYMASGIPVLATRIACHTNVVGDKRFALWAESENVEGLFLSLVETWEKKLLLSEKGHEAILESTGWTWAASACKLSTALEYGMG